MLTVAGGQWWGQGSALCPTPHTQGELELLVMEDGEEGLRPDGREHFSLKGILKREQEGQKVQRKRKAATDEVYRTIMLLAAPPTCHTPSPATP